MRFLAVSFYDTSLPNEEVVHMHYYVLPLLGFGTMLFLLFRNTGYHIRAAIRIFQEHGPLGMVVSHVFRGIAWTVVAIVLFVIANRLQLLFFRFNPISNA
jgi:hypothetical protein